MPSTHDMTEKTAIIDALLAKYDRSNSTGKIWRFSETGYDGMEGYCRLKRVLSFHQVPIDVDAQTKMVFIRGHLAELQLEQVVRMIHPGLVMHPFDHQPLRYNSPRGWSVQGRPDGIIWPNTVVEFKSINADAKLDKPHESHECQVMLTMWVIDKLMQCTGQHQRADGRLYYDKAGREFCVEPFHVEQDGRMDAIIRELDYLHENYGKIDFKPLVEHAGIDGDLLKERREKPDKFPCHWITRKGEGFCGYYHLCWGDRPAPIRRRTTAPRRRRATT